MRKSAVDVARSNAQFSTSARFLVRVGDKIPSIELVEGSPGNKVNLANEITGKALVIGVPAAFSTYMLSSLLYSRKRPSPFWYMELGIILVVQVVRLCQYSTARLVTECQ